MDYDESAVGFDTCQKYSAAKVKKAARGRRYTNSMEAVQIVIDSLKECLVEAK